MGENLDDFGPRFPDMSKSLTLQNTVLLPMKWLKKLGIKLDEGVYIGVTGPTYETPEQRFVPIRHWEQMQLVCLQFLKLLWQLTRA